MSHGRLDLANFGGPYNLFDSSIAIHIYISSKKVKKRYKYENRVIKYKKKHRRNDDKELT